VLYYYYFFFIFLCLTVRSTQCQNKAVGLRSTLGKNKTVHSKQGGGVCHPHLCRSFNLSSSLYRSFYIAHSSSEVFNAECTCYMGDYGAKLFKITGRRGRSPLKYSSDIYTQSKTGKADTNKMFNLSWRKYKNQQCQSLWLYSKYFLLVMSGGYINPGFKRTCGQYCANRQVS